LIVAEKTKKLTRHRTTQIVRQKQPIETNAYYTITELTSDQSPYRICSQSTIFRALRDEDLIANYVGRKVLFKGSAVHDWLAGKEA